MSKIGPSSGEPLKPLTSNYMHDFNQWAEKLYKWLVQYSHDHHGEHPNSEALQQWLDENPPPMT